MTDNNKSPETIFHPPSSVFTHFFSADMLSVRLMPLFEWLPVPQRLFPSSWHKRQLVNWPQQLIYTLHKERFWNLILFLELNAALKQLINRGSSFMLIAIHWGRWKIMVLMVCCCLNTNCVPSYCAHLQASVPTVGEALMPALCAFCKCHRSVFISYKSLWVIGGIHTVPQWVTPLCMTVITELIPPRLKPYWRCEDTVRSVFTQKT